MEGSDRQPAGSTGASIPLVIFEGATFRVNDAALDVLSAIEPPLAVVSVAGVYRTGKSFLLNRVILNGEGKFTVGPTTRACTKGIWMWAEPIVVEDANGQKTNVVVIDTEGIGATTADASHDTRIFALGLLLSSYFIYNSMGSIDEQALDRMSLVANLSKEIRGKVSVETDADDDNADVDNDEEQEQEDGDEESEGGGRVEPSFLRAPSSSSMLFSFPAFLWVVRDFALQLRDADGRAIGAREYLEDALRDCDASTPAATSKNRIRAALRDFFPERDCYTMVRPCTDEGQLQLLDTLPDRQLRPEFLEQARELRARIVEQARRRPMKVNECELSGSMLGLLCRQYVDAINAGQVPVIQDAWSYVCDAQRAKTEAKLVAEFQAALAALPAQTGIVTPGQFASASGAALQRALDELDTTCRRLFPHDVRTAASAVEAMQQQLAPLEKHAIKQFHTQYTLTLGKAVSNAQRDVEGCMSRQEYASITDFRKALHQAHKTFLSKYVDMDDDSVRDSANAAWYADAESLVWRGISEYYSKREQQLASFKAEAERLDAAMQDMTRAHATALLAQEQRLREEAAAAASSFSSKVETLESALHDVREALEERTSRVGAVEAELLQATQDALDERRTLEQAAADERARAEAAERKIARLTEELDESTAAAAHSTQLAKNLAEVTLDRNRLRAQLDETSRELEDTQRTKREVEATFRREAKEMQQKALQSLQAMKDMRATETAKLKRKQERAETRCAELEGRCRGLEEEQARKTQQMERAALEAEQQARQLRADVEASKARMASAELEYGTRLQEAEQVRKEKERALQDAVKSAMDERSRLDKEHARRLGDAESRADAAVRDAADYKRKLEEAMEQLEARKRQRVDPMLTTELEQVRFERNSLQRNMTLREEELRALKTENAKITKQLRETERKLDSETTTLRLEYESRLAELERRQMHAASSSDEE